jgi:hypothetical protein
LAGRRRMRATTRTGGTGRAVCFPFWHSTILPEVQRLSFGRAAAILTTARLPAARSPMARADPSAHVVRLPLAPPAAQYKAAANHFTALRKRRHRGRYRRSRAMLRTGGRCGLQSAQELDANRNRMRDRGLAGGRASKQGRHWASTCIRSRTRCALREGLMRIWLMRCGDPRRGGAFMRPVQAGRPTVWRAL